MFLESGDDFGLFTAYLGRAQVAHMHARMDAELEATEHAIEHARRVIDLPFLPERLMGFGSASRLHGSTPVPELLAWLDEQEEQEGRRPGLGCTVRRRWRCSRASPRRGRSSPICGPSSPTRAR